MTAPVPATQAVLDELVCDDIVARIWSHDPAVWRDDPDDQGEITNRLGWLTAPGDMRSEMAALEEFGENLKADGIRHAVLLGMGGSSLCPEVLRAGFGSSDGFPELMVLDSTVPEAIAAVEAAIDPARTIFVVSSKSGTTTEVHSFYQHFRSVMERGVGATAGRHFVAVTDPGSLLEGIAREQGFRAFFNADSNVGGRYSAYTHFGIVPAALIGLDLDKLLSRGEVAAALSGAALPAPENAGARLGAELGANYRAGRDKLTFITSPRLASFGLWAEQLLAESTGKDGRGILPIAGEPAAAPDNYGDDRVFAYLRLKGDDNATADAYVERLKQAGHIVIDRPLADIYDLGAEFYYWEFATAIVGAILGIHPFDQPNVQESKDATNSILDAYKENGALPTAAAGSFADLLAGTPSGGYLAIMAYIYQTDATDAALDLLRRLILETRKIPTTLGYGPRFLHSTGQLHKGGKPNGAFLQMVQPEAEAIPIPGQPYGFDVLVAAQSLGDMDSLQSRGRPVARIELGADPAADIKRLEKFV